MEVGRLGAASEAALVALAHFPRTVEVFDRDQ